MHARRTDLIAELEERIRRLEAEVLTLKRDALTGIPRREPFLEDAIRAIQRQLANKAKERSVPRDLPVAVNVVFFDLDGLKAANDRFGHSAGDILIRALASAIRRAVRPGDMLGRWGGDEFVAVVPGLSESRYYKLVEKVRGDFAAVVSNNAEFPFGEIITGVSAGWAVGTISSGEDTEKFLNSLIDQADKAMLADKAARRVVR